jgi:putative membrane protein
MVVDSSDPKEQPVRNRLALDRTRLANERTLLAYFRTAIMLTVTGATVLKFYSDTYLFTASGWALIATGIGVAVFGVSRFQKLARFLK